MQKHLWIHKPCNFKVGGLQQQKTMAVSTPFSSEKGKWDYALLKNWMTEDWNMPGVMSYDFCCNIVMVGSDSGIEVQLLAQACTEMHRKTSAHQLGYTCVRFACFHDCTGYVCNRSGSRLILWFPPTVQILACCGCESDCSDLTPYTPAHCHPQWDKLLRKWIDRVEVLD